jgi:hypothetical protein
MRAPNYKGTYKEIQDWVTEKFGLSVKTCSIADMKHQSGLRLRTAPNRIDPLKRKYPCPDEHKPAILAAFIHFGIIQGE